jgi:antitoxin VapB
MIATAKVFKNGASQAVRLPKEFRFDADEVCVKRIGSAVLLFPRGAAWGLMADALGKADEDFMVERSQPTVAETRKALETRKAKRR